MNTDLYGLINTNMNKKNKKNMDSDGPGNDTCAIGAVADVGNSTADAYP